jgi:DNA-binding MarR family transcriptional regulator
MTDYEELAQEFCNMQLLHARKKADHVSQKKADYDNQMWVSGEGGVLFCIYSGGGRMLAGDISRQMGLTAGRVTNILNALERRGYIVREQGKEDKRKVFIRLTDAGRNYICGEKQKTVRAHAALFEQLGETDAKEYFRILRRIYQIQEEMWERAKQPQNED